jgi:hypothetical protein
MYSTQQSELFTADAIYPFKEITKQIVRKVLLCCVVPESTAASSLPTE